MSVETPTVSIVIPMYNVQEYVGECLQSLIDQQYGDFEAICIDDGSTDATLERAKDAVGDDARFRFFTQENGGQSRARNFGIDQARGEYLMFLDADDYFVPHTLARLVEVARHDDLDYLDFTAHTFYETPRARELRNEDYYETRPDIPGVMTGAQLFVQYQRHVEYHCSPCLHFVARSLVEGAGLRFEEGIIHEDELFSPVLIAQAKRARYLNEVLYWRRMREGSSITSAQALRSCTFMLRASEGLHAWLRQNWGDYDAAFIDAMAQRVHELRGLAVGYACDVQPAELAEYAATLQGDALITFDLVIIGGLADVEAAKAERLYYARKLYHGVRKGLGRR